MPSGAHPGLADDGCALGCLAILLAGALTKLDLMEWSTDLVFAVALVVAVLGLEGRAAGSHVTSADGPGTLARMPDLRTCRLLALATFLALWVSLPHTDPDLWGHLIYGQASLVELAPQPVDVYSYTASGARWVNHEWWSEATLAALWFGLGGWAMYALALGMGFAVFGGMLARVDRTTPILLLMLVGGMSAAACAHSWAYRPQLFSFACYPALLVLMLAAREGRAPLAAAGIVALFALWPNLHGGFLAGLCVLGLGVGVTAAEALARRRPWREALLLVATLALSLVATLATPYGTELWAFLFRSLGQPRPAITEWAAVWELRGDVMPGELVRGLACLALGLWLTLRKGGGKRDPLPPLILLCTAVLWLRHTRHLPFVALTLIAVAPPAMREWSGPLAASQRESRPQGVAMLLLSALLLALGVAVGRKGTPVGTREYPVAALRILDGPQQRGRLMIHFNWAQYAIYRLHPRWRVAYDGRFRTVYPGEVERRFMAWNRGSREGWSAILDGEWAPDIAMLPPDAPSVPRMLAAGWLVVHRDATSVMMTRDPVLAERLRARAATLPLDLPPRVPFPGR